MKPVRLVEPAAEATSAKPERASGPDDGKRAGQGPASAVLVPESFKAAAKNSAVAGQSGTAVKGPGEADAEQASGKTPAGAAPAGAAPAGAAPAGAAAAKAGGDGESDQAPKDAGAGTVRVVPGIARYHRDDCILIRFLAPEDLEIMTRDAATAGGCVPCKACQPDKVGANAG